MATTDLYPEHSKLVRDQRAVADLRRVATTGRWHHERLVKLFATTSVTTRRRGLLFAPIEDADVLMTLLRRKLREEAIEFADDPSIEELADVYQAMLTIAQAEGWSMDEVADAARAKYLERGGFWRGVGMYVITKDSDESL